MIWPTVNSRSCFCCLYRGSPSLATKNIINLISVSTLSWYPCVEFSLGLLEKGVSHDQCVLFTKLLAFALLLFVLQGQTGLLFQVSLDFLLLHSNPQWTIRHLFCVLVLEVFRSSQNHQLQLLWHHWSGHRLGLLWCWIVCLGNELRSFCHFWDCTQVLHFRLFCWLWGLLHFF